MGRPHLSSAFSECVPSNEARGGGRSMGFYSQATFSKSLNLTLLQFPSLYNRVDSVLIGLSWSSNETLKCGLKTCSLFFPLLLRYAIYNHFVQLSAFFFLVLLT